MLLQEHGRAHVINEFGIYRNFIKWASLEFVARYGFCVNVRDSLHILNSWNTCWFIKIMYVSGLFFGIRTKYLWAVVI